MCDVHPSDYIYIRDGTVLISLKKDSELARYIPARMRKRVVKDPCR